MKERENTSDRWDRWFYALVGGASVAYGSFLILMNSIPAFHAEPRKTPEGVIAIGVGIAATLATRAALHVVDKFYENKNTDQS